MTTGLGKKNILITGGSSGIGRQVAISCAKEGSRVIILGRNKEQLERTIQQMEGNDHIYRVIDFNKEDNLEPVFQDIVLEVGKLNGLVHCAGVPGVIPLKVISREKMQEIMNVNFFSFIELVKQYTKKKFSSGGSIVGISSIVAERGELCQTIYSASKGAMDAAVKCLAIELAPKGIRINTVAPGMIQTEMMDKVLDLGSKSEMLGINSILGIGSPQEVSNAVLFLLSDLSSYTTGRCICVDGGCLL